VAVSHSSFSRSIESSRVPRREAWLAAALLFALMAVVQYDVLFQGKSLVLTNHFNPLDYRALPQNYGESMVPADEWTRRNLLPYANIQDPGGTWWQWEPAGEFLRRAISLREWPFWDPYIGAGTPAMANLTPAFFFPPYGAVVALGASVAVKNAYLLSLIWSAGFFTFLFLRTHRLMFVSSLFGAAVVLMGGTVNQSIDTIMGQAALCLPPCIYATRLFLDAQDRRRTLALALIYAGIALASFPPVLIGVFGIAALYMIVALALAENVGVRGRVQIASRWFAVVLIAVGLVSFYYVPALALRRAAPYVVSFYQGAGLDSIPLIRGYQLLSPMLMGGVPFYLTPPIAIPDGPHVPYLGLAALLAALLCRPGLGARARVLFYASAIGSFVILLKLFGIPPVQWAGHLPLLNQIHFAHYFGLPLGFLLAFLGALGVESLLRGLTTTRQALVTVVLAVLVTESLWWVARDFDVLKSPSDSYWIRDWMFLNAIASACTIVILMGTFAPNLRKTAVAALLILVAVEGTFNGSYPSPDAWDMFDHPPPYVKTLQQQAGVDRVLPFGTLNANLNSAFEIFSLDSLMPINPPRVYELYMRYTGAPQLLLLREAGRIPSEPILDRANIKFVAIRDAFPALVRDAQARGYSARFNDGYVWLFERQTAPRFFFSSQYRVMPGKEALTAVETEPSQTVILEEQPFFASNANTAADPGVRVEAYHRNSVTLVVDAPRPGLVYASESYFDGWTALVNGKPAPILPANYAFRAVAVPSGRMRIEFRYWPPGLTPGLVISGLSAALLVAFAWFSCTRPASCAQDEPRDVGQANF
jgi:hypothetical protein